jgi:type IV pilus assembly protein PilY1
LLVITGSTQADDIDLYLDAGNGPRRLVLVFDWQGINAMDDGAAVSAAIASAMAAHAAYLAGLPQPSNLTVSLLRPPSLACGDWPGCRVDGWALSPPREISSAAGRAALASDLDHLRAAALVGTAPPYTVEGYWTALADLLERSPGPATCGLPLALHLLWSEVGLPPAIDPRWRTATRSIVIARETLSGVAEMAALVGAELALSGSATELPGRLQRLLLGARGSPASLLSASVPGFTPQQPATGEEVLFPLFRPASQLPWPGNVKALKLVTGEDGLPLMARAPLTRPPRSGLDPVDGGIDRTALTFWTDPEGKDVQAFDARLGEVPGADGRSVLRGGAGQALPGVHGGSIGERNADAGARQLYLLDGEPGLPLPSLDATPESALLLGLPVDAALADSLELLRWIRGQDRRDLDGDGDRVEPRAWLLGAIMHSQPVVIDYGLRRRPGLPLGIRDRRLLFGSNDGLLRLLDISAWDDPARQGRESWAALPAAMLGLQRRLLDDHVAPGHRYGVDGRPVVYRDDRNGDGVLEVSQGDRVWAFQTLRRGGAHLYAMDLSDPDVPRLLWQVSPDIAGFEPMALGFSTPRIAYLDLGEPEPRLALVYGGGYNGGWRSGSRIGKEADGGADDAGNAIFVVDAATGELLWRAAGPPHVAIPDTDAVQLPVAAMRHGVSAPVTLLDSDADGMTDRGYMVDSGGGVWRLDMPEASGMPAATPASVLANWRLRQIAALGGAGEDDRRFFHALDVARTRDELGDYEALLLTSGDRAQPAKMSVRNFAYLLKDRGRVATPTGHDQLPDVGEACRNSLARSCTELDLSRGWRLLLKAPGEKGLASPLLRAGRAYFSTYRPPAPDALGCREGLGKGALYAVRLSEGAPALESLFRPRDDAENPVPIPGERAVILGEGIPGPVIPWREYLILPGRGVDGRRLVEPAGRMRWRSHWRENGVD